MKTLSHHTVSSLETGTVFQSFVLYSEWQASGVVGLDRISLAKLGLHVPEFHFLHSPRLAWAMGDILHDICKAEVNQQLYSLYTGRSAQGTWHFTQVGTANVLAQSSRWARGSCWTSSFSFCGSWVIWRGAASSPLDTPMISLEAQRLWEMNVSFISSWWLLANLCQFSPAVLLYLTSTCAASCLPCSFRLQYQRCHPLYKIK